jgi:hypothetical protein
MTVPSTGWIAERRRAMHIGIGVIMALVGLIVICQGPKAVFRAAMGALTAGILLFVAMVGGLYIMNQTEKVKVKPLLDTPVVADPTPGGFIASEHEATTVPMINHPQEFDRLPRGAAYTDASGKVKHKR